MNLSHLDTLLIALGQGGQILLLIVAIRTRLYRSFPVFCLYILYSSVSDIVLLTLLFRHVSEQTYATAYFSENVGEFLLQIGILVEVARNVLQPVMRSLPQRAVPLLVSLLPFALLLALLLSRGSQPARLDQWSHYFIHLSFAVAILRLAIFAVIAGFSQFLGIGWKNHVLQIATGFMVYSSAILLVELLHRFSDFSNPPLFHLHEQFRMVVWCMALGYWSYALSRVEATRKEFSPKMAQFLISMSKVAHSDRAEAGRWYRK
jgi:hypothetical protein